MFGLDGQCIIVILGFFHPQIVVNDAFHLRLNHRVYFWIDDLIDDPLHPGFHVIRFLNVFPQLIAQFVLVPLLRSPTGAGGLFDQKSVHGTLHSLTQILIRRLRVHFGQAFATECVERSLRFEFFHDFLHEARIGGFFRMMILLLLVSVRVMSVPVVMSRSRHPSAKSMHSFTSNKPRQGQLSQIHAFSGGRFRPTNSILYSRWVGQFETHQRL